MPDAATTHRRSLELGRERDALVRRLLERHPATASMLVRLGWFPTKNKALKRLRRLRLTRRVRLVGTVSRKIGRPEHVWCAWQPKADQLAHEVDITDLCLRIDASEIHRGPHLANDDEVRADAEVWINGQRFRLEVDRGTMGYLQIERRFRVYEGCPDFILWVCPTEARLEGMHARALRLRSTALFATRDDVLSDPHAPIWRDIDGGKVALPRQR